MGLRLFRRVKVVWFRANHEGQPAGTLEPRQLALTVSTMMSLISFLYSYSLCPYLLLLHTPMDFFSQAPTKGIEPLFIALSDVFAAWMPCSGFLAAFLPLVCSIVALIIIKISVDALMRLTGICSSGRLGTTALFVCSIAMYLRSNPWLLSICAFIFDGYFGVSADYLFRCYEPTWHLFVETRDPAVKDFFSTCLREYTAIVCSLHTRDMIAANVSSHSRYFNSCLMILKAFQDELNAQW